MDEWRCSNMTLDDQGSLILSQRVFKRGGAAADFHVYCRKMNCPPLQWKVDSM